MHAKPRPRLWIASIVILVALAVAACETSPAGPTAPADRTGPKTTTGPTALSQCESIGFEENSDNVASDIVADGVPCDEAHRLVRAVAATHNFSSGARSFTTDGYRCTVVTETTDLPVGHYTCTAEGRTVRWDQT